MACYTYRRFLINFLVLSWWKMRTGPRTLPKETESIKHSSMGKDFTLPCSTDTAVDTELSAILCLLITSFVCNCLTIVQESQILFTK